MFHIGTVKVRDKPVKAALMWKLYIFIEEMNIFRSHINL